METWSKFRSRKWNVKVVVLIALIAAGGAVMGTPGHAIEKQAKVKSEIVMKTGSKVSLFHSGTADVKKEICLQDVIPVYRETMGGGHERSRQVGRVKVLGYAGDHYFNGQVVDGEVKVGDVAKKDSASCLVQSPR